LLARLPATIVTDIDAGCCGMAGSFGYTREHYDVSRAIGELKLFPAARSLSSNSALAASGTSCRHQILHFTGTRAVHPAILLRAALRLDGEADARG
jgi:Fe-S oxidoreductase